MASRGWGRRGRPWDNSQPPPIFYQQAFIEAMGATVATLAQASEVGSQGGSSNLQMFKAHHPPTFMGGGDPMVANHWFRQVEKVLEAMEITSDAVKIRLAAFQLYGESHVWWDWVKISKNPEVITWESSVSSSWASFSQHLLGMQRLENFYS